MYIQRRSARSDSRDDCDVHLQGECSHTDGRDQPSTIKRRKMTRRIKPFSYHYYYSLDSSVPSNSSTKYTEPFIVDSPLVLRTISYDQESEKSTASFSHSIDIPKRDWSVVSASSGDLSTAALLIDENPNTFWATDEKAIQPQEIVVDLGKLESLKGFTYWPIQERYPFGIITDYEFSVSTNARNWKKVAAGEFANIVNSRLEQRIDFPLVKGRYIKLKAKKVNGKDFRASFAEVGVITEE